MGEFEQVCNKVDTDFNEIMGTASDVEQAPVTLLRAAAKMMMTTYPEHKLRGLALANVYSSVNHLKALEKIGGDNQ